MYMQASLHIVDAQLFRMAPGQLLGSTGDS